MEKGTSWDLGLLLEVLTQGEEQIRQLEARLGEPSSAELCKSLAHQIQLAFNKAISMAKSMDPEGSRHPLFLNNTSSGSPRSASGSPRSENSERAHERRELPTKRKTLPKWTSQVRISSNASAEGPLDDGFNWRKYGQKDILGAKYPRGYYRCTYRKAQGCLAMKQVQRSDEDPTIFDITYRGSHTCLQRPRAHSASASQELDMQQNQQNPPVDHEQQHPPHDQHLLLSFQTGLKVKTEGLAMEEDQGAASSSFYFPSTSVSSLKSEKQIISSPPTLENNFTGSFFPTFFPPTTSEWNSFSVPCLIDNYGGRPALHASDSDITEMISATTSGTPMIDIDFMLEPPIDFEQNFPFDNSKFSQLNM